MEDEGERLEKELHDGGRELGNENAEEREEEKRSKRQRAEHPSKSNVFPSSHSSAISTIPLPQKDMLRDRDEEELLTLEEEAVGSVEDPELAEWELAEREELSGEDGEDEEKEELERLLDDEKEEERGEDEELPPPQTAGFWEQEPPKVLGVKRHGPSLTHSSLSQMFQSPVPHWEQALHGAREEEEDVELPREEVLPIDPPNPPKSPPNHPGSPPTDEPPLVPPLEREEGDWLS